jgi:enoyl-[acyl-carrier-protein] reductase (NADH)
MLETRELGELVAFLVSDRGAALTGMLLPVDGAQMKSV